MTWAAEIEPIDVTARLAFAAAKLKSCGFKVVQVSMRSEAVYYALPDYAGLLRLASHKRTPCSRDLRVDRPTVARLTITGVMKPEAIEGMIWQQTGRYLLWHDTPEKRSFPSRLEPLAATLAIPPSPARLRDALTLAQEAEQHAWRVVRDGQLWNEAQAARCLQECAATLRDLNQHFGREALTERRA